MRNRSRGNLRENVGQNCELSCSFSCPRLERREARCNCAGVQEGLALGFSQHLLFKGMTTPLFPAQMSSMRAWRARQPGADPGSCDTINTVSLLLDRHPKEREKKGDANRPVATCHEERKLFLRDCKIVSIAND